jgi:hypothetical protein
MRTVSAIRTAMLAALLALACGSATDPAQNALSNTISANATVRFAGIEGGCWVLEVGGGGMLVSGRTRYQPINLPERFEVDGLRVTVTLRELPDVASICMAGQVVRIETIRTPLAPTPISVR